MRRILLLAIGALALALAVPSLASAHGRHHGHHHHAKAHHARIHHLGAAANTNPADPNTPDAGTVTSFDNGVLTITLGDGSVVRGAVTNDTVINCIALGATAASHDQGDQGDQQGADDQGDQQGGDQGDQQGGDQGDQQGGDQQGGDQGDQQGGDDHGDHGQATCDTTDLVAGTVVHEAILRVGSGGAQFKMVLLDQRQGA